MECIDFISRIHQSPPQIFFQLGRLCSHQLLFRRYAPLVLGLGFKAKETRLSLLAPVLFDGRNNTTLESIALPPYNLVGCANGLVCVYINADLFFWNPVIRKLKKLPTLIDAKPKKGKYCETFFAYNETDDDYQVYIITCRDSGSVDERLAKSLIINNGLSNLCLGYSEFA
ncbi:OLC1v1019421C1 [Oldenlandia corymbosa var. corymbosa]|uniref:OLC1v1019421C1 n=1 Tax=Oldenlandia corymbosa var. corymbosa TaxID=529605 RepID=A0AAV1EE30_OLDCO|nr:OLC1v1019421C1 [Oldenlandia corymbosa var. corymbosa]